MWYDSRKVLPFGYVDWFLIGRNLAAFPDETKRGGLSIANLKLNSQTAR